MRAFGCIRLSSFCVATKVLMSVMMSKFFLATTWCRSTIILRMDLNRTYTCRRAASRDAFTLGSTPQVTGMVLWWFPPGTREQQLINCYDFIIVRVCVQYIYKYVYIDIYRYMYNGCCSGKQHWRVGVFLNFPRSPWLYASRDASH